MQSLLIAARKEQNLTQTDVAERLKRPQSFVAKYEGGERRLDLLEFIDVARALEAEPGDLLSRVLEWEARQAGSRADTARKPRRR